MYFKRIPGARSATKKWETWRCAQSALSSVISGLMIPFDIYSVFSSVCIILTIICIISYDKSLRMKWQGFEGVLLLVPAGLGFPPHSHPSLCLLYVTLGWDHHDHDIWVIFLFFSCSLHWAVEEKTSRPNMEVPSYYRDFNVFFLQFDVYHWWLSLIIVNHHWSSLRWDLQTDDQEEQTRPEFEVWSLKFSRWIEIESNFLQATVKTTRINPVSRRAEPFVPGWSRFGRHVVTGEKWKWIVWK